MVRALSVLTVLLAGTLFLAPPAVAGDQHLSPNTIFFVSSDDWGAARTGIQASDGAAFLEDPEIQAIKSNLWDGFSTMLRNQISAEAGEGEEGAENMEAFKEVMTLLRDYGGAICEKSTGRLAFSVGYLEDSGLIIPEVLLEFHGGDEFDGFHDRIIETMKKLSGGKLKGTNFDLGGVSFKGVIFPPEPPSPPVKAPDGLFFGHKENLYLVGISRKSLGDYLTASGGSSSGRLGDDPLYRKGKAITGKGSMKTFLSTRPIWKVVDMALGKALKPEDGDWGGSPDPNRVLEAMGLRSFEGMYASGTSDAKGSLTRTFIGIQGREGLFGLIPAENTAVSLPKFVPANVIGVQVMHMEI
ncbi:MAG: hypothetical protein O6952_01865, partial [Planctomycetota bacterium]|nr:hypothetical protein [Planctomycetota bacterium]